MIGNNPVILILGRQNVGKSTLFNRLIGYKKAIIDSTPGVTRDIVSSNLDINGIEVLLYDSGGISDDNDTTNALVQKKTFEAVNNADLIIFVAEAGNPMLIEKDYIRNLKKKNKNIIIAVNKSDIPEKDMLINEFYNYGAGEPIPISASHNRNMDLLREIITAEIKKNIKTLNAVKTDSEEVIKISIIGKPNVGKSSLLNKIINKERSIVSPIPGTTRDLVDEYFYYKNKKFLIIDTAGIRKKTKVYEDVEYYSVNRAIKSINDSDIIYFIIDSLDDISDQDKKIIEQVTKSSKPMIVLLNKWDLQDNDSKTLKIKKDNILFKFPIIHYAPIIPVSAKTGMGIDLLLKTTIDIDKESNKKIDTPMLNSFIQDIIKKYTPSSKKGIFKIFYATQTSTKPVEFIFFVNNKKLLKDNYIQYIVNKLRESFGFKGIPIKINFKNK